MNRLLTERAVAEAAGKIQLAKGEKGDDGYTPIKGKDYFTPQDIEQLARIVQSRVKNGTPGLPGKPGAPGKTPTPLIRGVDFWTTDDREAIVSEVLKRLPAPAEAPTIDHEALALEAAKKALTASPLKIEHIEGLPKTLGELVQHLRAGGFRGGGGKVLAGSNVTITNNADGSQTVASTGGSGFTKLAATETPNGTLTVFTFSTATAQPSFIISDGVWMEAAAQDGTINWTWNAGAKQATMTIAPTSGIRGIA